jgi:ElaB/YqjD/DUF883 family membrane-anchored ribosome-binding protein
MNKVFTWLKKIRLAQVLTVFLAGVLLIVSTACNGAANARGAGDTGLIRGDRSSVKGDASTLREEVPENAVTNKREGGMNNYSDIDPRMDASKVGAKSRALVDKTERNVIDQTDDLGTNTKRILDKKGENLKHLGQNAKEDAAGFGDKAQNATEAAAGRAKEASRKTQQAAEQAASHTKGALNKAGDAID